MSNHKLHVLHFALCCSVNNNIICNCPRDFFTSNTNNLWNLYLRQYKLSNISAVGLEALNPEIPLQIYKYGTNNKQDHDRDSNEISPRAVWLAGEDIRLGGLLENQGPRRSAHHFRRSGHTAFASPKSASAHITDRSIRLHVWINQLPDNHL
jgi:hypothetical protein